MNKSIMTLNRYLQDCILSLLWVNCFSSDPVTKPVIQHESSGSIKSFINKDFKLYQLKIVQQEICDCYCWKYIELWGKLTLEKGEGPLSRAGDGPDCSGSIYRVCHENTALSILTWACLRVCPAPGTFNPPDEHVPCHGAKLLTYTSFNPPPPPYPDPCKKK